LLGAFSASLENGSWISCIEKMEGRTETTLRDAPMMFQSKPKIPEKGNYNFLRGVRIRFPRLETSPVPEPDPGDSDVHEPGRVPHRPLLQSHEDEGRTPTGEIDRQIQLAATLLLRHGCHCQLIRFLCGAQRKGTVGEIHQHGKSSSQVTYMIGVVI